MRRTPMTRAKRTVKIDFCDILIQTVEGKGERRGRGVYPAGAITGGCI
jgi:hypothetical protein